jgi:hypothetical protein
MGLRAGALQVGMLASLAMGAVTRHVAEAVGSLVFSVHCCLSCANQLTLSLLVLRDAVAGTLRPEWRLRNGQAWPPRLRRWSGLWPLASN